MNTMQSHDTGVLDRIVFLSEPDILTSHQYYDQETKGRQPEKRLMSAVLLDAVECFQKYLLLHAKHSNRLVKEAENWILDNDREWLLRQGLLHWKQNAMRSVSTRERTKRSA